MPTHEIPVTERSWRRGLLRWVVRLLVRTALRVWMPLGLQRWLLDVLSVFTGAPRQPRPQTVELGGVRSWFYAARGDPDTAVLYLHGGGYVAGSPRSHRNLCVRLCRRLQADVHAADYRLAPEHPFPAAVDDAFAAYQALLAHPRGYRRVVVMGDSAGGGLTLALAIRLRDAGLAQPAALIAFSPWVDMAERIDDPTIDDDMIDPRWADKVCNWYLREHPHDHPWASPLHADLRGLAPTLIQAGGDELLADQARRMGASLEAAGVLAVTEIYARVWHVFQTSAGTLPDADRALDSMERFLAGTIAGEALA